jgi:2-iminobutanoate/2-iminopropanoate deaminase
MTLFPGTAAALGIVGVAISAGLQPATAQAPDVEFLNSGEVLPTNLPFSEAVRVGNTLYLSGQIGNIPGTLDLAEGGMEGQARQVMDNIQTSLEAHGYSMDNVVKCLVMLEDMDDWPAFNTIYAEYFTEGRFPARSAFGSSGLAVGAVVEVECIAVVDTPD